MGKGKYLEMGITNVFLFAVHNSILTGYESPHLGTDGTTPIVWRP